MSYKLIFNLRILFEARGKKMNSLYIFIEKFLQKKIMLINRKCFKSIKFQARLFKVLITNFGSNMQHASNIDKNTSYNLIYICLKAVVLIKKRKVKKIHLIAF